MIDEQLDLDSRELCPDGACTGVIGDDGKCGVCGAAAGPRSERTTAGGDFDADASSDADPIDASASNSSDFDAGASSDFDHDRKLCPDGACVGLLGDDGKCKVCGTTG